MKFGRIPVEAAEGAILAHSVLAGARRLRKGGTLTGDDIRLLIEAGVAEVTVARLDQGDTPEDEAAARIASALVAPGLSVSAPFTGRANLYAESPGLLVVDRDAVDAVNRVHEAVTLATLPNLTRVAPRQMVATAKIIPYGAPTESVRDAESLAAGALALHPFRPLSVCLIQTTLPGLNPRLLDKGEAVMRDRLAGLGLELRETTTCAHDAPDVARAIGASDADLILILGGSATSDRADACPAGLVSAGGKLIRFGMPVDPGNLLFLGQIGERPILGLPGCARSPALNGADWVLERLAAGLEITGADIAAMGVGGLLKEISTRPQPRGGNKSAPKRPLVEGIILAAGASTRMRGCDKLLEAVDGQPQLARIAAAATRAGLDRVQVVLGPDNDDRAAVLDGIGVTLTRAVDAAEGMAASIRAGMGARDPNSDAVILILADMPDVTPTQIARLSAAFDPSEGRSIVQAVDDAGSPGHPVLFGRRFFEALSVLTGDTGARAVVQEGRDYLVTVRIGAAATTDLDTPEDWVAWRTARDTRVR